MARSTHKKIQPVPKEKRTEPYWKALNEILDPELDIGIVDLGLIYKVDISSEGDATIYMTLTSPGCPVGPQIVMMVEDCMRMQPGINDIQTHLVWDPPWTQERMDPDIRELMWGV